MRRFFCFMVMSLLCLSAFAGAKGSSDKEEKVRPIIVFERTSYDFGDVPRKGGDLIKEFRFSNKGDAPLVIKKITKSCSCISVSYSRKPVLPGEKSVIKVKYEPHKVEAGIFHKVIQIYTNYSKDASLITIQGNSVDADMMQEVK